MLSLSSCLTPNVRRLLSMMLLMVTISPALAYERNQAVPVEKVVYGRVESIRHVTEQQLIEDRNVGWKTFGGAVAGGVIGHQVGGGSGRNIATVLGALLGGAAAKQYGNSTHTVQQQLIELMIDLSDGSQVMVLQDLDPNMSFSAGDEVRVVYFSGYVRVDLAM